MRNAFKIAVDVDNVILDLVQRFIDLYNTRKGTSITKEMWRNWNAHRDFGITDEEAYAIYGNLQAEANLLHATEAGVDGWLKALFDFHYIDIVTARKEATRSVLVETLEAINIRKGVHYNEIVLVSTHPQDVKLSLDYDIYIDDNPNLANGIHRYKKKVLLLYDQPWNRAVKCNEAVKRVRNWEEACKTVKEMEETACD